jgi:outer membrane protein assembly factor BamA
MINNVFLRFVCVLCLCAGIVVHAQDAAKPQPSSDKIEAVEFRGAKRTPPGALKALVTIKPGDTYDEKALQSDTQKLWNTGRFSDITVKKDVGDHGGVVIRFTVTERSN